MSKKFEYKFKLFNKIHQLQKRLTRSNNNPGHSKDKIWFREEMNVRTKVLIVNCIIITLFYLIAMYLI